MAGAGATKTAGAAKAARTTKAAGAVRTAMAAKTAGVARTAKAAKAAGAARTAKAATTAERTDPALWERVKRKWLRGEKGGLPGVWNARKAMLAVGEYKRRGGGYIGPRRPGNSLKKWEREDWGYVNGDPSGRYLPAEVRRRLTPAEARAENARKRGRKGEWVPYSEKVLAKMRRAGVLRPPTPAAAKKKAAKASPAGGAKKR
jgi:hypothetical protein